MGTSDQRFSLRWNNYQSHLVTAFESLLEEKDFVDVTLGVEGRKLPAHKMLLSACSPYFRDLLKVNHTVTFFPDNLMQLSILRATLVSIQSLC